MKNYRDEPPLEFEESGDVTIVSFCVREADERIYEEARSELLGLVDTGRSTILVDFDRVAFISSAMLGALVEVNKAAQRRAGRVALCRIGPNVANVVRLTGVQRLMPICPDRQTALTLLAQA